MLVLGFCALSLGVALGACLLTGRFYRVALVHAAAGLTGLVAIAASMRQGGLRGPFAWDALVLLAAAFAGGLFLYGLRYRRRPRPGLVVALHATAGGLAYLLLSGFVFGQ